MIKDNLRSVFRRHRQPYTAPRSAVFLDRDGVIVAETGYLHEIEKTVLLPGAVDSIRCLNEKQIPAIVVTNQAGIAHGYYGWHDFEVVQAHIESELSLQGAHFDGVWACGERTADHPFRKPNPGMLLDAAEAMNLDLAHSWLIGDKTIDIQTAIHAGLAGAILVRTGYGREMEAEALALTPGNCRLEARDGVKEAVSAIMACFQ